MSRILQAIKANLKEAMLNEVRLRKATLNEPSGDDFDFSVDHKTVSRAIISMFPELGKKQVDANDDDLIKLLKKYIGQEKERLLYSDKHITQSDIEGLSSQQSKKLVNDKLQGLGDKLTSQKIRIAQLYLPKQASEGEIIEWINSNLDLSKFKNKMQAMGPIMKQFKGCDGNFVKGILLKM